MSDVSALELKKTSYDQVPYESHCYALTQPGHLKTLIHLCSMATPDLENARVLELGCAAGGNIIPFAYTHPKAEVVGVDLSEVQIASGQEQVKALKLKNIDLRAKSIMDIDTSWGEFDFIICHGILSWVPTEVQGKIFEVFSTNLSENGAAVVSYNTLPGWNPVRTVREMMRFHAEIFETNEEKMKQVRLMLQFASDVLKNNESPYANAIKAELSMLSNHSDYYIFHDHMEEVCMPFYFKDILERASNNKLHYMFDSSIPISFLGNMPELVQQTLSPLVNDNDRLEQYMDFLRGTRFRTSIFVKNKVSSRSLNNENVRQCYIAISDRASYDKSFNKDSIKDDSFKLNILFENQTNFSSNSPEIKAFLYVLIEANGYPIHFDEVAEKTAAALGTVSNADNIEDIITQYALSLFLHNGVQLSYEKPTFSNVISKKPKVAGFVLYQARETGRSTISNLKFKEIALKFIERPAIEYLDGKHTQTQVVEKLIKDVINGKFSIFENQTKVEDEAKIRGYIEKSVGNLFTNLGLYGLVDRATSSKL